jgi:hypothetical protein
MNYTVEVGLGGVDVGKAINVYVVGLVDEAIDEVAGALGLREDGPGDGTERLHRDVWRWGGEKKAVVLAYR